MFQRTRAEVGQRPLAVTPLLAEQIAISRRDPEPREPQFPTRAGDLPLALAQAVGYVESTSIPLAEYLALFESQRAELWDDQAAPQDYQQTVATTWAIALAQLSPTAVALLRLCSCLSPEPIPRSLLQGDVDELPDSLAALFQNPLALNRVVQELRRYSLIEATQESLIVHRLVQTIVSDGLSDDETRQSYDAALRTLFAHFDVDYDDPRTAKQHEPLISHVLEVSGRSAALSVAPDINARLLDVLGWTFRQRGEYREARRVLREGVRLAEGAYDADDPNLAASYSILAIVENDLGNLADAKQLVSRAIAIDEKTYDADHPILAIRYSILATAE
jgi:tetratricopeptide (TPR) repeat protein